MEMWVRLKSQANPVRSYNRDTKTLKIMRALALRPRGESIEFRRLSEDTQKTLRSNASYRGWRLSFRNTPKQTLVWISGSVEPYRDKLREKRAQ